MRQFDIFRNPSEASWRFAPFVVVIQSHYSSLDTVLVAPLVNDKLATSVEIAVNVNGHSLVVALRGREVADLRVEAD